MGDRVSIAFRNGDEVSVVLFNHWGGKDFVGVAETYLEKLRGEIGRSDLARKPLGRLEPGTVMVDFVRFLTSDKKRVEADLYLEATTREGDNSDNGHFEIDVTTGEATHHPP